MIKDISAYLELHQKEYTTEDFIYVSYTSPNTMYSVSNNLDELLLTLSIHSIKMWHRCLSLLKRSPDATSACSITLSYENFSDILTRNYYYKAKKELVHHRLVLATSKSSIYVVNILYANKLYKPKVEL